MLKKIGIIFGILLLLIIVLLFIAITRVDHDPYFKESYYQTTIARLDSLQPSSSTGAIEAGFARGLGREVISTSAGWKGGAGTSTSSSDRTTA